MASSVLALHRLATLELLVEDRHEPSVTMIAHEVHEHVDDPDRTFVRIASPLW
jgi:hypothetical protein